MENYNNDFLNDENVKDIAVTNKENPVNVLLTPKGKIENMRLPFSDLMPKLDEHEPDIPDYLNVQIPIVYFNRYFNNDDFKK